MTACTGSIFRDINPVRTFIDQRFSGRCTPGPAIVINTGEDNYLTHRRRGWTRRHTVVVSQLLNEYFGREAGPGDGQARARGPAFRDQPRSPGFAPARGLAHAQLIRELFPDAPAEVHAADQAHEPATWFAGYLLDAFFNPGRG